MSVMTVKEVQRGIIRPHTCSLYVLHTGIVYSKVTSGAHLDDASSHTVAGSRPRHTLTILLMVRAVSDLLRPLFHDAQASYAALAVFTRELTNHRHVGWPITLASGSVGS